MSGLQKSLLILALMSNMALAQDMTVPVNATKHLPTLAQVLKEEWPTMQDQSIIAGQIEKESCITLTHSKCWNTRAELKTSREYGFGLGQLTIAYKKDGSVRFDNFVEMKRKFPQLNSWKWENRYDPFYQLKTIVLMDKNLFNSVKWASASQKDQYGFMLSAYNGGLGGVLQDRTLCRATNGCDSTKWFDNVEKQSFKTKIKNAGYGQSAFEINRGYVRKIMFEKRQKYMKFFP